MLTFVFFAYVTVHYLGLLPLAVPLMQFHLYSSYREETEAMLWVCVTFNQPYCLFDMSVNSKHGADSIFKVLPNVPDIRN